MAIHVALSHRTYYRYDRPVRHTPHVIRLRPAPHARTPVLSYSLKITGGENFIHWQQDPFSNWNARVTFPKAMRELEVEVEVVAEMAVFNPFDFFLEDSATHVPFVYGPDLGRELAPFTVAYAVGQSASAVDRYVVPFRQKLEASQRAASDGDRLSTVDFLVGLNQQVHRDVAYLIRLEPGVQSPDQTLARGTGSCRDSAWLLCEILRRLGFAARFVSGYLIQLQPDVKPLEGAAGAEADFTDLHAWCEVFLPGAGWIGLDPTSGLLAGEGHIALSCTPEPSAAAPVSGATEPCESQMQHEMRVSRIYESPRVTRPYSEAQWERIRDLGYRVDEDLEAGDVRLTMGGEPTFVSVEDPDGAEWNGVALSAFKRERAGELIKRLRRRFASGAFLHYGQGKWYPGESLPRWSLNAFWRRDGVPVWEEEKWVGDEGTNYGFGEGDAKRFGVHLAEVLGVDGGHWMPGYEDVAYYLWRERRLPVNVEPGDARLRDAEERERLARVFERGLGEVVGYALPLRCREGLWESGPWFLRSRDMLWLLPGDSPMGYRLPLDSLPWAEPGGVTGTEPLDPSVAREALPRRVFPRARLGPPGERPQLGRSADGLIRTALCVEPRHGRLHVFMPPLARLEDYLTLVAAVERTAADLQMPVILEGEAPPQDSRLVKLSVTPDPGVIEVNLHPSRSWEELVDRIEGLYEEARQTRLGAEKFMLDGRHSGTGGGNHLILGAETPLDSPLLRRPDLLRSLLTYWQNHPALSWVFSGLFIGPLSQAPRVDEARLDSLRELELAFEQIPAPGQPVAPWVVDRLFRNLLVDVTGNTHRAEFCIDKLYAPESSSGRLGLLELRGFEMPPHARMNLVQQLLLRGLVACFWSRPYTNPLVRWGADLHDRWMLPHFCEADLRDVLLDLRSAGYPFEAEWFLPHLEYRFPRVGEFSQRNVWVELRTALEPWHVLGEEPGGGGAVRYVDSSLERLQVKVRGMAGGRFLVLCNGRRVPLHPTGANGEWVGGVRFRAWQPPECLQPTIPPHAPLVFDLWDQWNRRSLGGCTYHVAHPGGRNYKTFPVNAYEAESRRLARFSVHGHTAGVFEPSLEWSTPESSFTLDLRDPVRG
jgi:uncharacterized protein (DUF2126 family)/transglutaminase-like putative cysteine protease